MTPRRRDDEGPEALVTNSQCKERMGNGFPRWSVMLTAIALLWGAAAWIYAIADGARSAANAVEIRVEVEKTKAEAARETLTEIKARLDKMDGKLDAIQAGQNRYFLGRKTP